MPVVGTFKAGKNSRAQISGIDMNLNSYGVTHKGEYLPTNNFECNGFNQGLIGFEGLDWSLDGDWDGTQDSATDPPGLYVREDGLLMSIYLNKVTADHYGMPVWLCYQGDHKSTATGKVEFGARGHSQADFTVP